MLASSFEDWYPAHPEFRPAEQVARAVRATYPAHKCLHELFSARASLSPERLAIVDAGTGVRLSYGELDAVTDSLARVLVEQFGVTVNCGVALFLPNSLDFVIAYIAALKAGGCYIPLRPTLPTHAVAEVLKDATPSVVVTTTALARKLPVECPRFVTDGRSRMDWFLTEHEPYTPPHRPTPDDWAYIVYSSGTTGKPKGIVCPHRGAVFSYHWRLRHVPYRRDDIVGCNVFFVWECLRPLIGGVVLVVIPDDVIYDPIALGRCVQKHRITRMLFTPSLLQTSLDIAGGAAGAEGSSRLAQMWSSLRVIWFCGEVVTRALRDRVLACCPHARVLNLFSISECHDVAVGDLSAPSANEAASEFCGAGYVLHGVGVHVLPLGLETKEGEEDADETDAAPLAVGAIGEVYVSGPTLAVGYLNQKKTTRKRFVLWTPPNGSEAVRVYRTGDRGLFRPDGQLEVLGRCDSMVKVRGYSIVLDAVEAALQAHPLVRSALVTTVGKEGHDKRLVAYIVLEEDVAPSDLPRPRLMEFLKERLDFYAVPQDYAVLESLPINVASGKGLRRMLPPLSTLLPGQFLPRTEQEAEATLEKQALLQAQGATDELPKTPRARADLAAVDLERTLTRVWADVLEVSVQSVRGDATFFELGGHSLQAARIAARLSALGHMDVPVSLFFRDDSQWTPTVRHFVRFLLREGHVAHRPASIVPAVDWAGEAALPPDFECAPPNKNTSVERVLLTGATGYLGSHVLAALLKRNVTVFCLVRAQSRLQDEPQARKRVLSALQLAVGAKLPEDSVARVRIVLGDLSCRGMDLSEETLAQLQREIDLVVHCGAVVNFVKPYSTLRKVNVRGTLELLQFCATAPRGATPFCFVSSLGVLPASDPPSTLDERAVPKPTHLYMAGLSDAYCRSKAVAELLVRAAATRGLPVMIVRPGNMAPRRPLDTTDLVMRDEHWNESDFHFLFFSACAAARAFPHLPTWQPELTPTNFCAHLLCGLVLHRPAWHDKAGFVYHAVARERVAFAALVGVAASRVDVRTDLSWGEWVRAVKDEARRESWHPTEPVPCTKLLLVLPEGPNQLTRVETNESPNTRGWWWIAQPGGEEEKKTAVDCPSMQRPLEQWIGAKLDEHPSVAALPPQVPGRTPLTGRLALVTGASSGIGAAIALALARAGAGVMLVARKAALLAEQARRIRNELPRADVLTAVADVLDRDAVHRALLAAEEHWRRPIDVLVNNAGVMPYSLMKNCKEEEWDWVVDVNCKGMLHCIAAALPALLRRGQPADIINISSDAGRKVFAGLAVYSGSKHFVEAVSRGLRAELAEAGVPIRVTTIQPGDVSTSLARTTTDQQALKLGAYLRDPTLQILNPDNIGQTVVWILSQPSHVAVNEVLVEPTALPI